jgi:hypothetical protein
MGNRGGAGRDNDGIVWCALLPSQFLGRLDHFDRVEAAILQPHAGIVCQ